MINNVKRFYARVICFFVIGCQYKDPIEPIFFELNSRLQMDSNGYYHMTIDSTSHQSIHRI